MAMSITTAGNADVDPLCGANAAVGYDDTAKDSAGKMAEAYVCNLVRYDVVTNWATIGAIEKVLITDFVARFIAIQCIAYDMSGFTSRIEAEDMINIHAWRLAMDELLLKDQKTLTFTQAGTP